MKLPRVGRVRVLGTARRLHTLLDRGMTGLLYGTVKRRGIRLLTVFTVELVRPQCGMTWAS